MTELNSFSSVASQEVLFEASHIMKSYGSGLEFKTQVLKGVSLKLVKGQSYALLGASGSGKSTLLYCLSLLEKIDSGKIVFQGQNISSLDFDRSAHFRLANLGFVFQFHHLIYELSVWENIILPAQIKGEFQADTQKWAQELLDRTGLSDLKDKFPAQLSGGEQQRVAVARALINRPALLFTDEATGNLDSEKAEDVLKLLLDTCRDTQTTVLSVTHDERLAQKYSHKMRMKDGKIIDENIP